MTTETVTEWQVDSIDPGCSRRLVPKFDMELVVKQHRTWSGSSLRFHYSWAVCRALPHPKVPPLLRGHLWYELVSGTEDTSEEAQKAADVAAWSEVLKPWPPPGYKP